MVTFSGGRDSSYGLHYIKTVLKMNPVAYSYDWGMITDLARRNQSRMCGRLGVEHILVSADIHRKRENIRKNIQAWLRKPELGMVPLFMAGDKHYFYYANQVARQVGTRLIAFCECPFEKTDFKAGFSGAKPDHSTNSVDAQSILNKTKLATYYTRNFLMNPSYLNASLVDTVTAFLSYYLIPRHYYLSLYHFIPWDERVIGRTLRDEYDWETATDTDSTWRIGDGTAPFYNLIYFALAGFTENDTFRSHQIREGVLGRDEALLLVNRDNGLREDSLQWYFDTLGLDMGQVVGHILKHALATGFVGRGLRG
ncbi:MAG: hypothetical protein M0R22_06160 [Dehalococcoidia bacterium]|nr:hypothetical protein [Dehalococcoidia bacterium]